MRKSERLFELIQILRVSTKPVTADQMAETLEVSTRTIYRDIASLQGMRVPIDGEAGIGYIMRPGYNLPPINFDSEEIQAIVVGLLLLKRTSDTGLQRAAIRIYNKLDAIRGNFDAIHVNPWGAKPTCVDLSRIRDAIHSEHKLELVYLDQNNAKTRRTILPIAIIYYVESVVIAAWCELRQGFRHFRVDRMRACNTLEDAFTGKGVEFRKRWETERHRS